MDIEIQPLQTDAVAAAMELARYTYHICLEPVTENEQYVRFFYEYVRDEEICEKMNRGELYLWGALSNHRLLGMGTITNAGQITMLYVLPEYQRQGIGRELLRGMKAFGPALYLERITVNATPAFTSLWFGRQGFKTIQKNPPRNVPFLAMECRVSDIWDYPRRHIPGRIIAGLLGTATLISTLLLGGFLWL